MSVAVERLSEEVRALPPDELDQFLMWLAEYEVQRMDAWDAEIVRDSRPGGRLQGLLDRVRADIAARRTKPLDEVLHDS